MQVQVQGNRTEQNRTKQQTESREYDYLPLQQGISFRLFDVDDGDDDDDDFRALNYWLQEGAGKRCGWLAMQAVLLPCSDLGGGGGGGERGWMFEMEGKSQGTQDVFRIISGWLRGLVLFLCLFVHSKRGERNATKENVRK